MKFHTAALKSFMIFTPSLFAYMVKKVYGQQVQLSVGKFHSCAFETSSASLKCWGNNEKYQLLTGDDRNYFFPIDVPFPDVTLVGVEAGGYSTCGISDDGTILCVGNNNEGQLGIGTYSTSPITSATAMQTSSEEVIKIAIGQKHSCIVYIGGGLACTGLNENGQLGVNDGDRNTPTEVVLSQNVTDVQVGRGHTCIVDSGHSLLCMGLNDKGQLGLGDNADRNTPTVVNLSDKQVSKLACGLLHTCIIDGDSLVWCWGKNESGQLGLQHNNHVNIPTLVIIEGNDALEISAGIAHTCFIKINSTIWCMGRNNYGQLGDGSYTDSNIPVKVNLPGSFTPIDIELGHHHSCVTVNGINQIYCWGRGDYGQLGHGGNGEQIIPNPVQFLGFPTSSPTPAPTKKPTPAPTASTSAPSASPIVSLYATAVCGGAPFKCKPQSEVAPKTATYGVRCCNETVFPASLKKPGCSVYGGSRVGNPRGCVKSATFQEAADYCASSGARLCTKKELLDKCAKSTGCGLNRVLVWSSEPAVAP